MGFVKKYAKKHAKPLTEFSSLGSFLNYKKKKNKKLPFFYDTYLRAKRVTKLSPLGRFLTRWTYEGFL